MADTELAVWIAALATAGILIYSILTDKISSMELKGVSLLFFIFALYVVRVELQFRKMGKKTEAGE